MIYCPGCGTANREGSRFCNQCGTALPGIESIVCPRCGKPNSSEAAHCGACGFDLARAQEAPHTGDVAAGSEEEPDDVLSSEATTPGDDDTLIGYRHAGGLPPWLDTVEWPEDGPAPTDIEDLIPVDEDFEIRLPQPGWSPDALPIEPAVGVPYRARERRDAPPPPEQKAAADLFAAMAAEEVHAGPTQGAGAAEPPKARLNLRWLAPVALLLATLAALIRAPGLLAGEGAVPTSAAAAMSTIAELSAGSAVLVAFEYDAGRAGEMQPIATALLHALFDRGVRVLVVSTQPEGAALAQMALDQVLAAHPGAQYGTAVANLGYVPGDEAAVRALAVGLAPAAPLEHHSGQPLSGLPIAQGIAGAKDLPLVVILGRDLSAVQRWIEQVAAPYGTPMVAGVPTYVEPLIGPYETAGQLAGSVAGLSGAAACERMTGRAGLAGQTLNAVRVGAWTAGGLVVIANLSALASWCRRRWAARRRR